MNVKRCKKHSLLFVNVKLYFKAHILPVKYNFLQGPQITLSLQVSMFWATPVYTCMKTS
jgi:hypothetical protein